MEFDADDDACFPATLEEELMGLGGSERYRRIPEKHLSSPITNGLIRRLREYALTAEDRVGEIGFVRVQNMKTEQEWVSSIQGDHSKNYSGIIPNLRSFSQICTAVGGIPDLLTPDRYPEFYNAKFPRHDHLHADLNTAERIYSRATDSYIRMISDVCKADQVKAVKKRFHVKTNLVSESTLVLSQSASAWSRIVDKYRDRFDSASYATIIRHDTLSFLFAEGYALVRVGDGEWSLMVYEQLQMIQDAVMSRFNTSLALDLSLHNGSRNLRSLFDRLLRWHDDCLYLYGNDAFELIKAPEALYKTHLTSLTSGDILIYGSFDRTCDKVRSKERKISGSTRMVDAIIQIVQDTGLIEDAVELFGLIKLSGHPTVYASNSAEAVRTEAMPADPSRPSSVVRLARAVKHMILSAYIDKHQEWPPLKEPPLPDTTLRRLLNSRATSLPLNSYPISELDYVRFGKFINFDYSEDYLKFLDDKAICPGACNTSGFWFGGKQDEPRRLLLKIMALEHFDTFELVERIRHGRTTRDEEVVELTQKERELKTSARCFCKLTFSMRCFFTLTEYNLGEYLMKDYFPQQTMTMSDTQTKDRLYRMAYSSRTRDKAILEVDFSRWNLRWRSHAVNTIARTLEDIFGLPGVFSQAHGFFTRSTIVLTDKHDLPKGADPNTTVHDWPISDLLWRGHKGGFEGIQQKLWTICTCGMIYICVWDSECSFILAGQGDNQVLVFSFRKGNDIRTELTRLLAVLELRCKTLNQLVKPDECVDSITVLTYSKEIYVLGRHYPYTLKFISRTMSRSDSDVPSLSSEISSICSTAVAVSSTLPLPLQGFFWQCFKLIRLFREHARFSPNLNVQYLLTRVLKDKGLTRFALLVPGSLGGLPVLSWGRFLIRGEVDELSWDVASLCRITPDVGVISADLRLVLDGQYTPPKPDLQQLIMDPMSIPLYRPKDQTRLIKECLEKSSDRLVHNRWIRDVMSLSVGTEARKLIDTLASTKPLYPLIMSDIYSCSVAGLRDDILSRFNMTRTIADAVGGMKFALEIAQGSADLLAWLLNRYRRARQFVSKSPIHHKHTYAIAKKLRSLWRIESTDVIMTSVCPLSSDLTTHILSTPCISARSRTSLKQIYTEVGAYPPNFGTQTRQKRSEHGYKIVTSSDTVKKLKSLALIASQVGAADNFRKLIDSLIASRSPWSLDLLEAIFPTIYGGVAAHRHDAIRKKFFGVLGSHTVPSHLCLSSDNSGVLSRGEADYPFIFQEYYLLLTGLFQTIAFANPHSDDVLAIGATIPYMEPLPTDSINLVDNPAFKWPSLAGNKLAYTTHLQVKVLTRRPPPNLIPRTNRKESAATRIASHYLSKSRLKTDAVASATQSILTVSEPFDVAEVANIHPNDLILGVATFCVIESTYHLARTGMHGYHARLNTILMRIAAGCAGPLARMLLLPDYPGTDFLIQRGIVLKPGEKSPILVAKQLAGLISMTARSLVRNNYILCNMDPFTLYGDTATQGLSVLRKLAVFWLLQPLSRSSNELVLPLAFRRRIFDASYISRSQEDVSFQLSHLIRAVSSILGELGQHTSQHVRSKAMIASTSWPPVSWDDRDADEAKRDLRSLERPLIVPHHLTLPELIITQRTGEVKFKIENTFAGWTVPEPPSASTPGSRAADLTKTHFLRPIGRYSSALSVWYPILARLGSAIRGVEVMVVGVGHGATARVCTAIGSKSVNGWDLQTSFPMITQREMGYRPPEIAGSLKFTWNERIFQGVGGNWLEEDHTQCVPETVRTLIIDIETISLADHVRSLPRVADKTCICRVVCSEDEIRYLIALTRATKLFNTSAVRQDRQSWIVVHQSQISYSGTLAFENVSLMSFRPFAPRIHRSPETQLARLNDILLPTGIELKRPDIAEIRETLPLLERLYHNLDDESIRRLVEHPRQVMIHICATFRMTIQDQITYIRQLQPHLLRDIALFYANVWIDPWSEIEHI